MSARRRARVERSAGGVVVREMGGTPHVLLIKDPYGNWGLPKGHIEPGERPEDAALREVAEETGLDDLRPGPKLGTIDWYFTQEGRPVHKFATFYLMFSHEGEPVPEEEEGITACVWTPAAEAASRVTYDNARRIVERAVKLLTRRQA